MSKIAFAKENGATCNNPNYAWSYINEAEKFIMFGAWKHLVNDDSFLIFSENWNKNNKGHKQKGYAPSLRHIERIIEEGYRLFTFPMIAVEGTEDGDGPTKTKEFTPELTQMSLTVKGRDFIAVPIGNDELTEMPKKNYWEGAKREVIQTVYERNPEARKICLKRYGYSCSVCEFNFEAKYGELGKGYIHVHHLVKVSERKSTYKVDPIKDLRPVCPNCHAMIHMRRNHYGIEELKSLMNLSVK